MKQPDETTQQTPQIAHIGALGVATYPAGATFGPRQMHDWEWVWIIDGHARYRRDATWFSAPPASLLLCAPGATDEFEWDKSSRTRHAYCHFGLGCAPDDWPPREQWPVVRELHDGDILRPLFRHLLSWANHGDRQLSHLTLAHMLTAWVRDEIASGDVPRDDLPEPVSRALKYLQIRLDERPHASIELDELARAAFVSPSHLCRVFRASTGRSPLETVRLARLDRAAVMLARSNYSIREIAQQHGFANQFHFSRQFSQSFGQSPQQLRTQLKNGAMPPLPRLLQNS